MQEILKPRVGPERIEDRTHKDGRIESRLKAPIQPDHRPVVVTESDMNQVRGVADSGIRPMRGRYRYLARITLADRVHCLPAKCHSYAATPAGCLSVTARMSRQVSATSE
jgi:hypothetical protein